MIIPYHMSRRTRTALLPNWNFLGRIGKKDCEPTVKRRLPLNQAIHVLLAVARHILIIRTVQLHGDFMASAFGHSARNKSQEVLLPFVAAAAACHTAGAAAGGGLHHQQIEHFHTQFSIQIVGSNNERFLVGAAARIMLMHTMHAHPTPSPRQPATMCHLALRNQPQPPLKLLKTAKHTRLHAAALPLR